ncbi:HGR098Cp [Eremothecium sinecaudum]|uniref:HGR098Cp n=1 Tax=Eremothecium sinecaudum TaxID=45286 RepID=A0A0X8HVW4_9SACH|nr:HGR098Cp [Eremothecium sinecaudum]AMD22437.1 HGR098Cp [Eremothecium sinecaudum]
MSKLFIPVVNCGKAHDADIFGLAICPPFTATCSGDGHIKLWKNKLLDGELPKDNCVSHFVNKTGVHHIDVLHTIERGGVEICIVGCAAFDGSLSFYSVELPSMQINELDLLSEEDKKRSYWAIRWYKSGSRSVTHKFAATEVNGNTRLWNFHPFEQEITDNAGLQLKKEAHDDGGEKLKVSLHFTHHGEYTPPTSKFATCLDISSNNIVATGYSDGSVVVCELSTLRPMYNLGGFMLHGTQDNSSTVRALKFSPLGGILAISNDSGSYGSITLYDMEYGEAIGNLSVPTDSKQKAIVSAAHNGWVFGLSFNSTGEFLASCGFDAKVRVWDVTHKEHVSTLRMSADDIEDANDVLNVDEHGSSLAKPAVLAVNFIAKGVRGGVGSNNNEGLCCVCLDRSVRWYREAGGI